MSCQLFLFVYWIVTTRVFWNFKNCFQIFLSHSRKNGTEYIARHLAEISQNIGDSISQDQRRPNANDFFDFERLNKFVTVRQHLAGQTSQNNYTTVRPHGGQLQIRCDKTTELSNLKKTRNLSPTTKYAITQMYPRSKISWFQLNKML